MKRVLFIVLGGALFYFGGWSWLSVETTPNAFTRQIDGVLISDSLAIYKQGFGILISNQLYGFEFNDRFFYSPLISWFLFGASFTSFRRAFYRSIEEEYEDDETNN